MAAKKARKLFQVAKELNLALDTLTNELDSQGFEATKRQMTPIPDEVYQSLLKRFAPDRWAELQAEEERRETEAKARETKEIRDAELQKIYEAPAPEKSPAAPAKKRPSVRSISADDVIPVPPPEAKVPEAEKPAAKQQEAKPAPVEEARQAPGGEQEEKPAEQPREKRKTRKKTTSPSVRQAPAEMPAAETEEQVKGKERHKAKPAARLSVRGAVSNDDIVQYTPPPKEEKPETPPPPPSAPRKTSEEEDEEGAKRKRKRKRKTRKTEDKPQQEQATSAKGGGWVATGKSSKRKRKRDKKKKVDVKEVQDSVRKTLAAMDDRGKKRRKRKITSDVGMVDDETNLLKVTEFVSTSELAQLMDVAVTELIKECMLLGLRVTINQRLEKDTIELLAEEHGYKVEFIDQVDDEDIAGEEEEEDDGELMPRPPVVTVMGHVDHGKTSLLDYIRSTQVVAGEAGGITQHIGAYEIEYDEKKITFLDTPGHEAFTAMRARGAQATDIVVLVIAADDQVMPQTVEAIDHAKAANVPMVVAINKMDKAGANPTKVKRQLADMNVVVEEFGGDVQIAEVSAKSGMGIEDLLAKILIAAEMLELQAVQDAPARGVVVESRLDKGRGTICTVLVQKGTLHEHDVFVAGPYFGRVRAMFDERGKKKTEAKPGQPVEITGFESAPHVGDSFIVYVNEKEARDIASKRQLQLREQEMRLKESFSKPSFLTTLEGSEKKILNLIIKGDVDGSVEAIADALMRLSTTEVEVKIIHRSVGPINESNVLLASASHALIIGFNVHPNLNAREMAARESVTYRTYRVIYELIEDIKADIIGMHRREFEEQVLGTIEVRDLFKISRIGTIAGCHVVQGKIDRSNKVRVIRDGSEIYHGDIDTLKRFKDDVKEVQQGYDCGIKVANFNDIKVGDVLESYHMVEVEREIEVEG